MKHYTGDRPPNSAGGQAVTVLDVGMPRSGLRPLLPRNDVRDHSPDGFQWGYGGSGPAQLALALCIDALDGDVSRALKVYQQFKFRVVARLPDAWALDQMEILQTIEAIEAEQ
jgi:hypothetical protein